MRHYLRAAELKEAGIDWVKVLLSDAELVLAATGPNASPAATPAPALDAVFRNWRLRLSSSFTTQLSRQAPFG